MPRRLVYLESWSRVETFHNLCVVKQTVGSISNGYYAAAAAVDVNAVHVSKCQTDVCG